MHPLSLHQGLLGRDPQRTPIGFRVTPRQKQIYSCNSKGISQKQSDPELFLATLVIALAQTDHQKSRQVSLFTPKQMRPWVVQRIQEIFRYAVRCRKGNRDGLQVLKDAFSQISLDHRFIQAQKEPDYWAAFGVERSGLLPPWLSKGLVDETTLV